MENLILVQHVENETHKKGGLLDHVISSNNMCIEVTKNPFFTTSDHSAICFSLNGLFVYKPTQEIVCQNFKNIADIYDEAFLNFLK